MGKIQETRQFLEASGPRVIFPKKEKKRVLDGLGDCLYQICIVFRLVRGRDPKGMTHIHGSENKNITYCLLATRGF